MAGSARQTSYEVRPLRGLGEMTLAEQLQRAVWQLEVDTSLVPSSVLLPISKNGGLVLGAFEGEALVGLCFSFLGRTPQGRIEHWSHMTGVLPSAQGRGLGARIKWAQREAVLAMGVDLIRWTVDPLEGPNASLNFSKLGVTCRTYDRNTYGSMPDGLNTGIESDRFIVEWELDSERVKARLGEGKAALSAQAFEAQGAERANLTRVEAEGIRSSGEVRLDLTSPQVLVEAPASFQQVKAYGLDLAVAWRMQTRGLFETYFARGYVATEFVSEMRDGERRNFYVLERA